MFRGVLWLEMGICVDSRERLAGRVGRGSPAALAWGLARRLSWSSVSSREEGRGSGRRQLWKHGAAGPLGCLVPSCRGGWRGPWSCGVQGAPETKAGGPAARRGAHRCPATGGEKTLSRSSLGQSGSANALTSEIAGQPRGGC